MSQSNLVATQIVDKNGKLTTVHVNPDKGGAVVFERPAFSAPPSQSSVSGSADIKLPKPPLRGTRADFEDKLQHTNFQFPGWDEGWSLAPEGFSGAYCHKCKSFYTDEEINGATAEQQLACSTCGFKQEQGVLPSGIRASSLRHLNKSAVRADTWYHITVKSDWYEDINEDEDPNQQPFVHIGTKEAALARMKALISETTDAGLPVPQFYCYELKIAERAPISDYLLPDDNDLAPSSPSEMNAVYTTDGYEAYGITRYVNEVESHGSISLNCHPTALEVTDFYAMEDVFAGSR